MNKAIFLDRDGVINKDRPDYVYEVKDLIILPGVIESLKKLRAEGFKLLVITNQSGIAKGIYSHEHVKKVHDHIQATYDNIIDHFYYAPWHPNYSESLTRKPGSLLFERAIHQFDIDVNKSWMIGDRDRDLEPAKKLGVKTILLGDEPTPHADQRADDLLGATNSFLIAKDV